MEAADWKRIQKAPRQTYDRELFLYSLVVISIFTAFILLTGGMAFQAVLEIIDALVAMFGGSFRLVMAGIASPRIQCRLVATVTSVVFLTVIHWEGMRTIIAGWPPA